MLEPCRKYKMSLILKILDHQANLHLNLSNLEELWCLSVRSLRDKLLSYSRLEPKISEERLILRR